MKQVNGKQWIALLLTGILSVSTAGCDKQAETAKETLVSGTDTVAEVTDTRETERVSDTEETDSEAETAETYVFEETAIDLPDDPIYLDASYSTEERVADLMQYMTLQEKVAQMMQPERKDISPALVKKLGIGSILSGGGASSPAGNKPEDWYAYINAVEEAALEARLGIPLLYGIDSVHGDNNVYGAVIFPHNIGIGATGDLKLAEEIAKITAEETHAIGANWAFAPCLGNAQNELWGRTYECFSENADVVAQFSAAYVSGLQNGFGETPVAACAKHYIGEGYTLMGMNQGNVKMTQEEFAELMETEHLLEPYRAAIEAGALTVMASYHSIDGRKCHGNKWLLTDVLRDRLGFEGLVISDYDGIDQIKVPNGTYREKVLAALDAGVDLFMEPYDWEDCMDVLIRAVEDGEISIERINLSVARILKVKFDMGLFEHPLTDPAELEAIGTAEHREVARQAVRESLVLLKNDMATEEQTVMEALRDYTDIAVVGKGANDIGTQCGGWTITWTGMAGHITEGTTILEGIEQAVGEEKHITYSEDGSELGDAQAAIVVLSEIPYSETGGDRNKGNLIFMSSQKQMIDQLKEQNPDLKIILLLLSGRPVTIAEEVEKADAVIAAWLPGSEGQGVADVLFGDYDFTGHLEFTWPWYAADIEKKHTEDAVVLFPYGSGLTRAETVELGKKPEK